MAQLSLDEMAAMTIGMCYDHYEEYAFMRNPNAFEKQATQVDIDRLKGR